MKPLNVLFTWLITLLVGLVIVAIVAGDVATGSIFTLVAATFSLPYLVIMLLVVKLIKSFWILQAIHLVLASLTALIIFGMDEAFVSDLYWVVFCYFGLGFFVHLYWWFYLKPKIITLQD